MTRNERRIRSPIYTKQYIVVFCQKTKYADKYTIIDAYNRSHAYECACAKWGYLNVAAIEALDDYNIQRYQSLGFSLLSERVENSVEINDIDESEADE